MQKHIVSLSAGVLIGALGVSGIQAAELNGDFRSLRSNVETQFELALSAYDATIQALLNENRALKAELEKLYKNKNISLSMERQKIAPKWDLIQSSLSASGVLQVSGSTTPQGTIPPKKPSTSTGASTPSSTNTTSSGVVVDDSRVTPTVPALPPKSLVTGEAVLDAAIKSILSQEAQIKALYFPSESLWGIQAFEFVDQKAVYVDFHTQNPSGPYVAKVLYALSASGAVDISKPLGVFTLDTASQRYLTRQGSNTYASVTNRRILTIGTVSQPSSTSTSTTSSASIDAMDAKIKAYDQQNARGKTAVPAAVWQELVRLSNEYIVLAPNSLEPYRYRYRANFMLGNTNQALADVLRITDAIDPKDTNSRPFFCNAYKIAQAAGDT